MNLEYKIIINNIEEVFDKFSIKNHIAVAISGGSDSLALVIACDNYCKNHNIKLSALTIDHKFRINSSIEAKKLHNFLSEKNIDHHIVEIDLADVPSKNIEANLRDIRYKLLLEFCHKNNIEYLFLGHHLGDIAENFLIRLFRGSGLDGLSPIQELIEINQIKIIRPFLNINKNLLQQFLQSQQIQWFEDETNQDDKFLRNKIRNFLASFPSSELIKKRIVSASKEIALARDLIDELSIKYQEQIIEKINDKLYNINIKNLQATNTKIAQRILINFLTKISKKPYKPRKEKFLRFYQILVDNKITKKHEFNHCVIEKTSDGKIIIYSKD
jgi:tRNA(Ile)-lysidine synthase